MIMGLLREILRRSGKRIGYGAVFVLIATYGWIALRGPQGMDTLFAKHREIRQLQEQNAAMARENQRRRDRFRRLQESPSEQEMEIRKQLKLQKPGETTFILPDAPKESSKTPDPE